MIDYQKELNEEQLAVVLGGDGPCLVLAGAGSGKTRTITYRVAYLLEQGVNPKNILLLTFTNRAAGEMVERLNKLAGRSEKLPFAGTFHSIGHKILRHHAHELGYKNNFSILDSDDSESLMKLCAKNFSTGGKEKKFPTASVLQAIISFARNAQTTVADVLDARYPQYSQWEDEITGIAAEFIVRKKESNAMDFDDLLENWLRLLNIPEIQKKYAEQFKYILVDEYQDTNKIQAAIVKQMAQVHKNIVAVGDDAQSIYSFRAADIENILNFEKDFPGTKIFRLETNYRSSQEILSVANDVIAQNPKQFKKSLKTKLQTGIKPDVYPLPTQADEAGFIVEKILELLDAGHPAKEIAVLFRAAHHSQQLELELMRASIDYDYRGGLRFFERSHVKDALAYLRVLNNLADTAAWMRVLLFEDGVGPAAAGKIIDFIQTVDSIEKIAGAKDILNDKARGGFNHFLITWNALLDIGKSEPSKLIEAIIESPYKEYLESERVDSSERINDLKQLAVFARKYEKLEEFLAEAALQEAFTIQHKKDAAAKAHEGKIVLSTIHQSKGLEWSNVFIINLLTGQFPHERAYRENGGVEEERRLFYVAITRAKHNLFLTYPLSKGGQNNNNNSWGGAQNWGEMVCSPSEFLGEISADKLNDHSFLSSANSTKFNEPNKKSEVEYIPDEDAVVNTDNYQFKPGSFLKDIDDL